MAFFVRSSIKSKLFSNSLSLLLGVKECVLSLGNPVSKGVTVSAPYDIEKGVFPVDLRGVVLYV